MSELVVACGTLWFHLFSTRADLLVHDAVSNLLVWDRVTFVLNSQGAILQDPRSVWTENPTTLNHLYRLSCHKVNKSKSEKDKLDAADCDCDDPSHDANLG